MRPLSRLTLIYLTIAACVVTVGPGPVSGRAELLAGFGGCAALALICDWAARRRPDSRLAVGAAVCCPLILPSFLYPAVSRYALVLRGRFLDAEINNWEVRILGRYPNLTLDALTSPLLTEFMMTVYFSFYLFAVLPSLWLLFRNRATDAEEYLTCQMLAVYMCYLGFLLVPLRGPASALEDSFAQPALDGYAMTAVQTYLMTYDPVGACFPSAHVATAWAGLLAMRRIISVKAFWLCLPLVLWITLSVVYNRYHYLSDAIAGILVALLAGAVSAVLRSRVRHPTFPVSGVRAVNTRHSCRDTAFPVPARPTATRKPPSA